MGLLIDLLAERRLWQGVIYGGDWLGHGRMRCHSAVWVKFHVFQRDYLLLRERVRKVVLLYLYLGTAVDRLGLVVLHGDFTHSLFQLLDGRNS